MGMGSTMGTNRFLNKEKKGHLQTGVFDAGKKKEASEGGGEEEVHLLTGVFDAGKNRYMHVSRNSSKQYFKMSSVSFLTSVCPPKMNTNSFPSPSSQLLAPVILTDVVNNS